MRLSLQDIRAGASPLLVGTLGRLGIVATLMIGAGVLGGCDRRRDAGPVVVSAIGGAPALPGASRRASDTPAKILLDSTAQGLVRFDAGGQVEPGIAERWIVIDDGMSYIFRLRDAQWSDGAAVSARDVVVALKQQLAPGSRNPLLPYLSAIDNVVEMTPEVIEVRLKRPRPDLLKLFAQPELALLRARVSGGSGPFRIVSRDRSGVMLRPAIDANRSPDDPAPNAGPETEVRFIGERAARAIARFAARDSDLVSGGSFVDWPLIATTDIAFSNQRIDPAAGLFGFTVATRDGFLADAPNRNAVAQAIDRQALIDAFTAGWQSAVQILPEQLDSSAAAAAPAWAALSQADRVAAARAVVGRWRAAHPGSLTLRMALPVGPGATLLYGLVGANLRTIGIEPIRVGPTEQADLRLIDTVAPYDSARWYLATACAPCSVAAQTAIDAARDAPSTALRAQHLGEADAALASDVAFIPLARPLRWSLVSLRLRQWQGNPRAWHPLNHLRADTN